MDVSSGADCYNALDWRWLFVSVRELMCPFMCPPEASGLACLTDRRGHRGAHGYTSRRRHESAAQRFVEQAC